MKKAALRTCATHASDGGQRRSVSRRAAWVVAAGGLIGLLPWALQAQVVLSSGGQEGGGFRVGTLPPRWETGGPRCAEMPEWQVHEYNPDLYILRQSGCTDFEKPFVFLLFGGERALLLDTGSRNGNLAPTLQLVMHRWLSANHRDHMPL